MVGWEEEREEKRPDGLVSMGGPYTSLCGCQVSAGITQRAGVQRGGKAWRQQEWAGCWK